MRKTDTLIANKNINIRCYIAFSTWAANPINITSFISQLELIEKDLKKGRKTDKNLWFRFFKNDTGATTIRNINNTLNVECYKGSTAYRNKEYFFECVYIAISEISLEVNFS